MAAKSEPSKPNGKAKAAKKRAPPGRGAKAKTAKKAAKMEVGKLPADLMVDAAFALAAERPWREIALREIAEASGLSFAEAYRHCPSKQSVLEAFLRRVDAAVLAEGPVSDEEGSARDRLFDVLMRRFDALQPYRKALASILLDQPRDPVSALAGLAGLQRSMGWMLETAGLDAGGLRGQIRVQGLTLIYLATLRTWLRDDSLDLAKTMAALDGYLRRIEGALRRLPRRSKGPAEAEE